ncbi:GNAT family N-acetyltransferase [Nocardioides sp.]|jgi:GNAT superfamily N-acetyltransferase|uniref:GNAT family N-acetyltransferase n=1 Tax=Nocardioides sp. TaxID=35761 RepID=UPI002F3F6A73
MLEIRGIDTGDEAQLHRWYDAWRASQSHRRADLIPSWEAAGRALSNDPPGFELQLFGAFDGSTALGVSLLNLPLDDNPTVAYADVMAHPDHRRRGVGSAVLEELERRAGAAGRERVLTEVFQTPRGDGGGSAFAESRGYVVANREGVKAVDLAAAEPGWRALEDQVAAALGDYRVVTWRDRCPDEYVDSFGTALSRAMSLIPQGDLDLEDRDWTVERVRAAEERRVQIGLATFESVAVAPDGSVVGLTGVRVSAHDPRTAHISVTMVLPEHRGHRLGLATKLDSHRALRAAFPECRLVMTSNAEVNDHMNAINGAMGYQVVETLVEYHKRL